MSMRYIQQHLRSSFPGPEGGLGGDECYCFLDPPSFVPPTEVPKSPWPATQATPGTPPRGSLALC